MRAELRLPRRATYGDYLAVERSSEHRHELIDGVIRTPCDPRTLARAARDHVEERPAFAVRAGLLALHWLVQGHGHDITSVDVWDAYRATLAAAERQGIGAEVKERVRKMVAGEGAGERFVTRVLGRAARAVNVAVSIAQERAPTATPPRAPLPDRPDLHALVRTDDLAAHRVARGRSRPHPSRGLADDLAS